MNPLPRSTLITGPLVQSYDGSSGSITLFARKGVNVTGPTIEGATTVYNALPYQLQVALIVAAERLLILVPFPLILLELMAPTVPASAAIMIPPLGLLVIVFPLAEVRLPPLWMLTPTVFAVMVLLVRVAVPPFISTPIS